jgi:hypothetical protein
MKLVRGCEFGTTDLSLCYLCATEGDGLRRGIEIARGFAPFVPQGRQYDNVRAKGFGRIESIANGQLSNGAELTSQEMRTARLLLAMRDLGNPELGECWLEQMSPEFLGRGNVRRCEVALAAAQSTI